MLIQLEEAIEILDPYQVDLYEVTAFGWEEYQQKMGELLPDMTQRSRASIVHDLTVAEAMRRFENIADIRIMEGPNHLVLFIFHDRLVVKFKKLDEAKRSSNIPTQMVLDFLNQRDPEIPGLPDKPANLEVGYQLNSLESEIQGIFVTHPIGMKNYWEYEIQRPASGNIFQLPGMPKLPNNSIDNTPIFKISDEGKNKIIKNKTENDVL